MNFVAKVRKHKIWIAVAVDVVGVALVNVAPVLALILMVIGGALMFKSASS